MDWINRIYPALPSTLVEFSLGLSDAGPLGSKEFATTTNTIANGPVYSPFGYPRFLQTRVGERAAGIHLLVDAWTVVQDER